MVTVDGVYVYQVADLKIVWPKNVEVLDPHSGRAPHAGDVLSIQLHRFGAEALYRAGEAGRV